MWPETMKCPKCGADAVVTAHEGQPIAEQVKRSYKCECGHAHTYFFDVVDRTVKSDREGDW